MLLWLRLPSLAVAAQLTASAPVEDSQQDQQQGSADDAADPADPEDSGLANRSDVEPTAVAAPSGEAASASETPSAEAPGSFDPKPEGFDEESEELDGEPEAFDEPEGFDVEPEGSFEPEPRSLVPEYDPLRDSPEAVESRRRIIGGGVMLGLGAAVAAGAVAIGTIDACVRGAGNSCNEGAQQRAVATMAVPAAAMMVGGGVLLYLGVRARQRLRATVSAGPRGIVIHGRF